MLRVILINIITVEYFQNFLKKIISYIVCFSAILLSNRKAHNHDTLEAEMNKALSDVMGNVSKWKDPKAELNLQKE